MAKNKKVTEKRTDIVRTSTHQYNPHITPLIVKAMVSVGATQRKVASELGIALSTLTKWLKKYPELKTAYDLGTQDDLQMVEASFFQMCMPHILTEEEVHYNKDGEIIKTIVKKKQTDPNVQALYRYLMCRGREKWAGDPSMSMPKITITFDAEDEGL
jgi:hypothetical protein